VNGPDDVYVERKGRIERVADRLFEEEAVLHVIERIVVPLAPGRRTSPWVDARLPDGSRVKSYELQVSLWPPRRARRR